MPIESDVPTPNDADTTLPAANDDSLDGLGDLQPTPRSPNEPRVWRAEDIDRDYGEDEPDYTESDHSVIHEPIDNWFLFGFPDHLGRYEGLPPNGRKMVTAVSVETPILGGQPAVIGSKTVKDVKTKTGKTTSRPRFRRSDMRDAEDRRFLSVLRATGAPSAAPVLGGALSVAKSDPASEPLPTRPTPTTNPSEHVGGTRGTGTKKLTPPTVISSWSLTKDGMKLAAYYGALEDEERDLKPIAMSLNCSPDVIAAANANERGATDHLQRRIVRFLKNGLGRDVDVALAAETYTKAGPRLHVHFGVALNDNELSAADEAVRAAGGGWARSTGGGHQLNVKAMDDPDGWATYCLKKAPQTRRDLRIDAGLDPGAYVKIIGVTASLKVRAKMQHDEARRLIRRMCSKPSLTRS